MIIRHALLGELPIILGYYMDALDELKHQTLTPDINKCAEEVLQSFNSAPCIVLDDKGDLFGFAGMRCVVPQYSNEPFLEEYMFYIRPDKRSMKAAKMLSDGVQRLADDNGLDLYMRHGLNGRPAAEKEKFLHRWGYETMALAVKYKCKGKGGKGKGGK